MKLAELKRDLPHWTWRAERHGMGWRYSGALGDRRVTVHAVGVLCGPLDDDYAVQWRVDDGSQSTVYITWMLRERLAEQRREAGL